MISAWMSEYPFGAQSWTISSASSRVSVDRPVPRVVRRDRQVPDVVQRPARHAVAALAAALALRVDERTPDHVPERAELLQQPLPLLRRFLVHSDSLRCMLMRYVAH